MFERLWRRPTRTVLIVTEAEPDPTLSPSFLRQPQIRIINSFPDDHAMRLARRKRPCLIIEDLQRPDSRGALFRDELRSDPQTCSIPLILLTEPELKERADRSAPAAVLVKPVRRQEFFREVRRFVPLPKRKHQRYGGNLRFSYRTDQCVGQAFSRDLSLTGAFLKTDRVLPLGTRLGLRFNLPGTWDEICCQAVVIRTSSGTDPQSGNFSGFAIEFDGVNDDDADRLQSFIDVSLGLRERGNRP